MGNHTLRPGAWRLGGGAFETAIRCACKHLETERETGQRLQAWCSGTVSEYMAAFRTVRDPHLYDAIVVGGEYE